MKGNYKLKWHKFTIYFALFTLTAITLFAAVPFFIGKTHAVINGSQIIFNNAQIYARHPMMQTYDILFGIFFVMYAILIVITRQKLAGFKKDALQLLYTCLGVSVLIPAAYAVTNIVVIGFLRIYFYLIVVSMIAAVILFLIYAVYYGKRRSLFTNLFTKPFPKTSYK